MAANDSHSTAPPSIDGRYRAYDTSDGTVIIYDEGNDSSWIESDAALALDDRR